MPVGDGSRRSGTSRHEARAVKAALLRQFNTAATCRKFYVHPGLIEAYAAGALRDCMARAARSAHPRELSEVERAVLAFLRIWTKRRRVV